MPDKDDLGLDESVSGGMLPPPADDTPPKVTVQYTAKRDTRTSASTTALSSADQHEDCIRKMNEWSGTNPDYRIQLIRRTPSSHEGRIVKCGILQIFPIMSMTELEDEVRNNYGGGSYSIIVQNDLGVRAHQTKFTIPVNEVPPVTVGSNGTHPTGPDTTGLSDARRRAEEKKLQMELEELEMKADQRRRQMQDEKDSWEERRNNVKNRPQQDLLDQIKKMEERHERELREMREETRRVQQEQLALMKDMSSGQKDSPMLAQAIQTVGGLVQAMLTKDNGSDKLAEAIRESNRDIIKLVVESKKDNGSEDKIFTLLNTVMSTKLNSDTNRMQTYQEGMQFALELTERMGGGSEMEANPDAGLLEKLATGVLNWMNRDGRGREIAARFMGKAVGALTQQDLQTAAHGIAPALAHQQSDNAPSNGNGNEPIFHVHGETQHSNPPAQPLALPHNPQPVDPNASLRLALNNTIRLAVSEMQSGVAYHTWPDYATQNVPVSFLQQLADLPNEKKIPHVQQYVEPQLFAQAYGLILGPGGLAFSTALDRLCGEHATGGAE